MYDSLVFTHHTRARAGQTVTFQLSTSSWSLHYMYSCRLDHAGLQYLFEHVIFHTTWPVSLVKHVSLKAVCVLHISFDLCLKHLLITKEEACGAFGQHIRNEITHGLLVGFHVSENQSNYCSAVWQQIDLLLILSCTIHNSYICHTVTEASTPEKRNHSTSL